MYTPLGVSLFVKFRKSPHRTEKSLRHAQKPANPRSANPMWTGKYISYAWEGPPYRQPPPKGRKMTSERPCPVLIETGKSYPKTGLFPAVFQRFSRQVRRRFSGGSTAFLPVVSGSFPAVFSASSTPVLPAVFRRFSGGFLGKFNGGFPAVFQRFSGGFPALFRRFSRQVRRRFDSHFPATRFPWINPQPAPAGSSPSPSSERNCRAIPYTLSRLQTQHGGIFESVFVTKRLAKLAGTNKN